MSYLIELLKCKLIIYSKENNLSQAFIIEIWSVQISS